MMGKLPKQAAMASSKGEVDSTRKTTDIFESFIFESTDATESDDDLDDIHDLIVALPNLVEKTDASSRSYHAHLPIDDGIYEGLVKDENMQREGLGSFSVNNGEEFYSGQWLGDKRNGNGYWTREYAKVVYYGHFKVGFFFQILQQQKNKK